MGLTKMESLAMDIQTYLVLDGIYLSEEQSQGLARCLLQDPEWDIRWNLKEEV